MAGIRASGFDAAVWFRFPFGEDLASWVRFRLQARGHQQGPTRHPYAQHLPEPPDLGGRPVIPCVYPNWDNTPRAGRGGVVITGSDPERFGAHLRRALEIASTRPVGEQVVTIKSWNEWAEGNYLEPDAETGRRRLEVVRREVARYAATDGSRAPGRGTRARTRSTREHDGQPVASREAEGSSHASGSGPPWRGPTTTMTSVLVDGPTAAPDDAAHGGVPPHDRGVRRYVTAARRVPGPR